MGDGTAGLCSHLPCVADIAHTAGCHAENQGGDSVSHITYISRTGVLLYLRCIKRMDFTVKRLFEDLLQPVGAI